MTKMICRDTLVFKNLPPELSDSEKQDFLVHFGATNVKIITSKYKNKSRAFAKFENEDVARNVLMRLHQMNILGSRLSVEYAEEELGCDDVPQSKLKDVHEGSVHFNVFLNKLNSWNAAVSFNQPPPPHYKYLYPKPNRATINNIAHALASVPKFYTQVLHLMNKMNLPPPFSNIPDPPAAAPLQPLPPQPKQQVPVPPPPPQAAPQESSSESEMESDPEDVQQVKDVIPLKRAAKSQRRIVKKMKFSKPPAPAPAAPGKKPSQNPDEVFEKVDLQNQKRIEVKVSDTLDVKAEGADEGVVEGFGIMPAQRPEPVEERMEVETEAEEGRADEAPRLVTEEELAANRISPRDYGLLPVFKNYHAGAPSCRLYIKNLAKNAELRDLEAIYRRYEAPRAADEQGEQGNMFDIRLMQEGRMKGQAFITLQSVAQAQRALKETNGYLLKNKPLVVVFARSAVPKPK